MTQSLSSRISTSTRPASKEPVINVQQLVLSSRPPASMTTDNRSSFSFLPMDVPESCGQSRTFFTTLSLGRHGPFIRYSSLPLMSPQFQPHGRQHLFSPICTRNLRTNEIEFDGRCHILPPLGLHYLKHLASLSP